MSQWPILSLLVFLPLGGAVAAMLARGEDEAGSGRNARAVALLTSSATLAAALWMLWSFDSAVGGFQFEERGEWVEGFASYHLGVDGLSILFVVLTATLTPLCILSSWGMKRRTKEYMAAFLALEGLAIGVFSSLDLVLFYVFFEGGLIPMFLIIGVWGGPRRVYAALKFFLYTLLGSLLMLLAVAYMAIESGMTSIPELSGYDWGGAERWLWLAFFASFAVKLPMWPFHTWLPDAHVEAPTAGSVMLAAVLLKLGGYGFVRFSLPMFAEASEAFTPFVYVLSCIAIVYGSLVALVQDDVKKLVAYSSVAHMGFVTLGIFAGNEEGVQGAVFQMLSHGWISAALFLCVGVMYERGKTREIGAFGGVSKKAPLFGLAFLVFTLANVGLPGTSAFVGEFLAILGAFARSSLAAITAATGVILSASYGLWLYWRLMLGTPKGEASGGFRDVGLREGMTLAPLLLATVLFGLWPGPILRVTGPAVERVVEIYEAGVSR